LSNYGNMTSYGGGQSKSLKIVKDVADAFKNGLTSSIKAATEAQKKFNDQLERTVKLRSKMTGGQANSGNSMNLGLGGFSTPPPPTYGGGTGTPAGYDPANYAMSGKYGTRAALAVASMAWSSMPNVMDAVNQRIASQSVASFSGMSAQQFTKLTNQFGFNGGAFSSSYGMQLAGAQMAFTGGYLPSSGSFNNVMGQVGGLSVATGLSNEAVASAYAGMNGMNALRLGINIRNKQGDLLKPSAIANSLYKRMYGNQNISVGDAMKVFNRNTNAYRNVMQLANGDTNLMKAIQTNLVLQAKNGGKEVTNLSQANKIMDDLGWAKDDPLRKNYKYNAAEARKLSATGDSQVKGYGDAADAAAAASNALATLVDKTGALGDAFSRLQGTLGSLGGFGNSGQMLSGLTTAAETAAMLAIGKRIGVNAFRGKTAVTAAEAATATAARTAARSGSVWSKLGYLKPAGKIAAKLGFKTGVRAMPVIGSAISAGLAAKDGYSGGWDWGNFGMSVAGGAVTGAIAGAPAYGVGAVPGALLGGLVGAGEYAVGFGLGKLGNAIIPHGQGGGPATNQSAGGATSVNSLVSSALSFVGRVPYIFGGKDEKGWDCSGFVQTMYKRAGVQLPRTAQQQSRVGQTINYSQAKPGDLLFFHYGSGTEFIDHVAIYIGGGMMVEAANHKAGTRTSKVPTKNLKVVKRVIGGKLGGSYKQLMASLKGQGVNIMGSPGNAALSGVTLDMAGVHGTEAANANSIIDGIASRTGGTTHSSFAGGAKQADTTATSTGTPTSLTPGGQTAGTSNAAKAWNFLTGTLGFTAHAAAGVIGNLMQESGVNPARTQNGGGPGRGIMQWTVGQRWATLEKWASRRHLNKWALDTQLQYMAHEMERYGVKSTLAVQADYKKATELFEHKMEKAGTPMMANRYKYAADALTKFGKIKAYDIGTARVDSDQLAQIHKDEMIIPAGFAEEIRKALGGNGRSGNVTVNLNVSLDASSDDQITKLAQRIKHVWEQDNMVTTVGVN
jgi:hypothetical protein